MKIPREWVVYNADKHFNHKVGIAVCNKAYYVKDWDEDRLEEFKEDMRKYAKTLPNKNVFVWDNGQYKGYAECQLVIRFDYTGTIHKKQKDCLPILQGFDNVYKKYLESSE